MSPVVFVPHDPSTQFICPVAVDDTPAKGNNPTLPASLSHPSNPLFHLAPLLHMPPIPMQRPEGIRTSQDLELAAGKRAVPLLLAMADSPVGNGDAVIQGLILDVLCTVASLERSGARYGSVWFGIRSTCRVDATFVVAATVVSFTFIFRPNSSKDECVWYQRYARCMSM